MGEASLISETQLLRITADLVFYGNAANEEISRMVAADIQNHWNLPNASVSIKGILHKVQFEINGFYKEDLTDIEVFSNTDPRKNYFRIEEYAEGNISFVDGINSNTGYFKLDNLLNNSTTAAHEFGHTLGLEHPAELDIRGRGVPGIMYPRGTIVDPEFQYDPMALPLAAGGTMNPFLRKVLAGDIADLHLQHVAFNEEGRAVVGDFSSVWHDAHPS